MLTLVSFVDSPDPLVLFPPSIGFPLSSMLNPSKCSISLDRDVYSSRIVKVMGRITAFLRILARDLRLAFVCEHSTHCFALKCWLPVVSGRKESFS